MSEHAFKEEQLRLFRQFVRETAPVSGLIVAVQRGAIRFFGDLSIAANRRLASMPADEAEKEAERWIRECSSTLFEPGIEDDSEEKREKNAERHGEKRR